MENISHDNLKKVADEVSRLMAFDTPLGKSDKGDSKEVLINELKEVSSLLYVDDELSKNAVEMFRSLKCDLPKEWETKYSIEEKPVPCSKVNEDKVQKVKSPSLVPTKKVTKRKKSTKKKKVAWTKNLESLIQKGEHTKKELVDILVKQYGKRKRTYYMAAFSNAQNPKYNPFEKLIKIDSITGIISFK